MIFLLDLHTKDNKKHNAHHRFTYNLFKNDFLRVETVNEFYLPVRP